MKQQPKNLTFKSLSGMVQLQLCKDCYEHHASEHTARSRVKVVRSLHLSAPVTER